MGAHKGVARVGALLCGGFFHIDGLFSPFGGGGALFPFLGVIFSMRGGGGGGSFFSLCAEMFLRPYLVARVIAKMLLW